MSPESFHLMWIYESLLPVPNIGGCKALRTSMYILIQPYCPRSMLETHLLVDRPVNINACTVQYVLVQDSYKTHTRLVQDPL